MFRLLAATGEIFNNEQSAATVVLTDQDSALEQCVRKRFLLSVPSRSWSDPAQLI
jgi:hypothetical protein